jgi:hypothetical protein
LFVRQNGSRGLSISLKKKQRVWLVGFLQKYIQVSPWVDS